jgi:hypothetical protein
MFPVWRNTRLRKDLKPCVFCAAFGHSQSRLTGLIEEFRVICTNVYCHAQMATLPHETAEHAELVWNVATRQLYSGEFDTHNPRSDGLALGL